MARLSTVAMALLMRLASQTACVRQTIHINSEAKVAFGAQASSIATSKRGNAFYGFSSIAESKETLYINKDFKYNQAFEGGEWETDGEGLPLNRTVARHRTNDENKHCGLKDGVCNCRGKMCIFPTSGASQRLNFSNVPESALCEYKVEPTKCSLKAMNTCKEKPWTPQCKSKSEQRCSCDPKEFNAKFDDQEGTPRYVFERVIGEGGYGTVVKAIKSLAADKAETEESNDFVETEKHVVVKFIPREKWRWRHHDEIVLHTAVAKKIASVPEKIALVPAVVETIRIEREGLYACNLFFITDYVPGDNLVKWVNDGGIQGRVVHHIFSQLAPTVKLIHDMDIVHRDIKLENIMYAEGEEKTAGTVALLDFGLAAKLVGEKKLDDMYGGTLWYFAPEICQEEPYRTEVDVWSLGVVLYFLVFNEHPFIVKGRAKENRTAMCDIIIKTPLKFPGQPPKSWEKNDLDDVKDLLQNMLQKDLAEASCCWYAKKRRFHMKQVLEHAWMVR